MVPTETNLTPAVPAPPTWGDFAAASPVNNKTYMLNFHTQTGIYKIGLLWQELLLVALSVLCAGYEHSIAHGDVVVVFSLHQTFPFTLMLIGADEPVAFGPQTSTSLYDAPARITEVGKQHLLDLAWIDLHNSAKAAGIVAA
jgi:hypothetical protein